ncbi:hypothetical protein QBC44DRAFT_366179 [Cladorrhinum sp. PSN332]|nr:hypothetical protein QBC44DRAFT_366179 [Cladorrhinum sp. PSN332]
MPMPNFNPFTSVSGKHACALFEIRLENDFIVFRGNDHEASAQVLKGTVVLCLTAPLKIENVHLKLTGTIHYGYGIRHEHQGYGPLTLLASWTDQRVTATGISNQKVDKTIPFFENKWQPFIGTGSATHTPDGPLHYSRSQTLPIGNYEWPFELTLPGDTTESVEGMREASITWKLKATVARGKLATDLHAYKRLRVIRTLEASALEFLHAMSVENIWPNKIEYSIMVPQKAVVFGSSIPLETRFTPLLKGLEIGDISVKLIEVHDIILHSPNGHSVREHKKEREIDSWKVPVNRTEHWQDMIEDTGQEGWVVNTTLNLPMKLNRCLQDVNAKGIKVRHKLKLVVALQNPDGHISELRATLPVTIFISPNMPLDEDGNLVRQMPTGATSEQVAAIAPPGYGEHVLDQLYDDIDPIGLQTPAGGRSAVGSPIYGRSRAGSYENLAALTHSSGALLNPALLSSRLQSTLALSQQHRNQSWSSVQSAASIGSGYNTPHPDGAHHHHSPPVSIPLTRHNSGEESPDEPESPPEHVDFPDEQTLAKVPSYHTACKTPVTRPLAGELPDYWTAVSAPSSPPRSPPLALVEVADSGIGLGSIAEVPHESTPYEEQEELAMMRSPPSPPSAGRRTSPRRRASYIHQLNIHGEGDERSRLRLLQARERVA